MSLLFGLRFDCRNPAIAGTSMAQRYAAMIEMCEWADTRGCLSVVVSEHHGQDDGYLPSPLVMLGAIAARTTNVRLSVAALIAPFYDPLRLAEDMVVLDHLSNGRVDLIVANGYVKDEFEMLGVPIKERAKRVTTVIETLKAAFTGEPFEYQGRTVRVTPAPLRPGGPALLLGGSSEPAARRAARIADGFIPSVPEVWEFYRDELVKLGKPDPGPSAMGHNRTVALAEDVDAGWEQMGPYFLHEMNAYGKLIAENDGVANYHPVSGIDELRNGPDYAVLTPDELIAELKAAPVPFVNLHPLCGGMPIDLAWSSLRLLERDVLPAFS
jgi:alkanesulfonate monooxygenase SsuD/methylene tetrahydromethanopterin reductase-like flavin-dependent oxidoreductase (luciferase family)